MVENLKITGEEKSDAPLHDVIRYKVEFDDAGKKVTGMVGTAFAAMSNPPQYVIKGDDGKDYFTPVAGFQNILEKYKAEKTAAGEKNPPAAKPEAPVVTTPAEEEKKQKLEKWYEALPEDLKSVGKTVLDYAKAGKDRLAKVDFNEDGKPDFSQLANGAGTAKDMLVGATKTLKDKGEALWEEKSPGVGKFFGDNARSLLGGAGLAMLMMLMFEMGPIGALIMGMLAFGAMSALGADGGGGLLSNLFSGEKKEEKKNEKGAGRAQDANEPGKEADGKEKDVSVPLLGKDGKPIQAREDGTQVIELTTDTHGRTLVDFLKKNDSRFARYADEHEKEMESFAANFDKKDPKILLVGKIVEDGKFHATEDAIFIIENEGKKQVNRFPLSDDAKILPLDDKGRLIPPSKEAMKGAVEITSAKLLPDVPQDVKTELARQGAEEVASQHEKKFPTKLDPKPEDHEKSGNSPKGNPPQVVQRG